jgi:hypothetical protein
MKIVYIAGLEHSGSTILDMALGCNKNIVGLGEIIQILKGSKSDLLNHKNYNDVYCSCGSTINNCDFWKNAKQQLVNSYDDSSSSFERYSTIMNAFKAKYGNEMILLDSSKNRNDYLDKLNRNHELKIIHLVRDVRSWCYSRRSRLGISYVKLFYKWYVQNIKILQFLKKNKLEYKTFGYEEIALYPEVMLKEICNFIGTEYDEAMLIPDRTKSHVFNGNVAKGDKNKRKSIMYDARWLTSLPLSFYCLLFFPLMIFNRNLVYQNFMKGKTIAFNVKQQDFILFGDQEKEKLVKKNYGIK